MELYEQLLSTKLYSSFKMHTMKSDKAPESLPHVLAGCPPPPPPLAQNKYFARHNAALQVLFFKTLRELRLVASTPPWYLPVAPKPSYESRKAQAFWDILLFAKNTHVQQNSVDARFINHKGKAVHVVAMSCLWIDNRSRKEVEKTLKYGPLRWELKQQFPGYKIKQYNIIIDVSGEWSWDVNSTVTELFGARGRGILHQMQGAVISGTLNIARTFKIVSW